MRTISRVFIQGFRCFCVFAVGTLLCLIGTLFGQPISTLPVGERVTERELQVRVGLYPKSGGVAPEPFTFKSTLAYAEFREFLENKLRGLRVLSPQDESYGLIVEVFVDSGLPSPYDSADVLYAQSEEGGLNPYFHLEKRVDGWAIPEEFIRFRVEYRGPVTILTRGITGFEITAWDDSPTPLIFSTITLRNDLETYCAMGAIAGSLSQGHLLIPRAFAIPGNPGAWWKRLEYTLWENQRFKVFDGDGNELRRSEVPPNISFPTLFFRRVGQGKLQLTVTVEGELEEKDSLGGEWVPALSLNVLSESEGSRHFLVSPTGSMKLYRVRPVGLQKQ
ncbi:MAG: hypothetical protein A2849_02175 [Candidatus Taylorbacteria bacterium RIFCSPHIGHO2_01_FULL_51_15]|uniref:Uncharacterized protein n=1 Tax=Candidatus Taylorbacteria bacterium RIFCSPHIGHO2_01_FULL_51_15 TaxID=1802304 RepID=A0A1G2MCQ3_9BACT|nr:MAG: hypothetical protein A2849_02175 [Candidatus Taylorbacteria bacterium RIFCSPHIGHO2_01_FULL_51_15]